MIYFTSLSDKKAESIWKKIFSVFFLSNLYLILAVGKYNQL